MMSKGWPDGTWRCWIWVQEARCLQLARSESKTESEQMHWEDDDYHDDDDGEDEIEDGEDDGVDGVISIHLSSRQNILSSKINV